MGTDIFKYIVLSIEGREAIIEFYSGQSVGLADLTASFWVDALCSAEGAFIWADNKYGRCRTANCALTRHELFRGPTGDVGLEGGNLKRMEDVEALLKKVNDALKFDGTAAGPATRSTKSDIASFTKPPLTTFGWSFRSSSIGDVGLGGICFNSVAEAQTFIDYIQRNNIDNKTEQLQGDEVGDANSSNSSSKLDVYFQNVRHGPEFISKYDGHSEETFQHFVESVNLEQVCYECIDYDDAKAWKDAAGVDVNVDQNKTYDRYWNTKAKYRLVMKDTKYLEHLRASDEWYGR